MKLKDIPDIVVDALRQRGFTDSGISSMSAKTLFEEYCNWEGFYNYGDLLWNLVLKLRKAEHAYKKKKNS